MNDSTMNEEPLSLQDFQAGKEQRQRMKDLEHARLKLEAEARDNGEQLREMAEKVFQLLERLKLAELGKKKSMEALTKKELESFALKKQQTNAQKITQVREEFARN